MPCGTRALISGETFTVPVRDGRGSACTDDAVDRYLIIQGFPLLELVCKK